ncbi:MAG: hypothetical protein JWR80_9653 [Bradyrhizobium sp.]|nr:hypothetical protein [Bradyrhizobium sp.]
MVWRARTGLVGKRLCAALIASCCAALLSASRAPAAPPAQIPQAAAVAQRVWSTLLTHCGDSYFYAGSFLDGTGPMGVVIRAHSHLLEFKGVTFHLVPIRVTDAERANGTSERARITMVAHIYREDGGPWEDGPDLVPRDGQDILRRSFADVAGDQLGMGQGGAIAIEIIQHKGRWALVRSSTRLSGPIAFDSDYYYVDQAVSAPAPHYNCNSGTVTPSPPSAAEIAAKKAADDAAAAQARQQALAKNERRAVAAERKRDEAADRAIERARARKSSLPGDLAQVRCRTSWRHCGPILTSAQANTASPLQASHPNFATSSRSPMTAFGCGPPIGGLPMP